MFLKYFRPVFFTVLGIAAVYFYFNFGPVYTGAPTSGSAELMYVKGELDRQSEISGFEDGMIGVTEYAVLGYREYLGSPKLHIQ